MSRLFIQYYYDVTKFNVMFCALFFAFGITSIETAVIFGTFGTLVSLLVYNYFYKIQYYFYINGGFTKRAIQLRLIAINLILSTIFIAILWIIA